MLLLIVFLYKHVLDKCMTVTLCLELETLPSFLFISTATPQSLVLLHTIVTIMHIVFLRAKTSFVWSSPYTYHWSKKNKRKWSWTNSAMNVLLLIHVDEQNSAAFKYNFWRMTSQNLPVFWLLMCEHNLLVKGRNAIVCVNSIFVYLLEKLIG